MLLFKAEHKEPINSGKKTQTRRTWKKCRVKVGSIHQCKLDFKKGSKPFAHVKVLAVRREALGDITESDAKAEGYSSIEEYKEVFKKIYGVWDDEIPVWVVDFEQIEPYPECDKRYCPFHECMGGKTCRLESVKHSAPHLIKEHAKRIAEYCSRPLEYSKIIK